MTTFIKVKLEKSDDKAIISCKKIMKKCQNQHVQINVRTFGHNYRVAKNKFLNK